MPMDRSRYPADWESIAQAIKTQAGWRCQHCGRPCRKPGEKWFEFAAAMMGAYPSDDLDHPQRFTLTVAHLDQNPSNNDPSNLSALCSGCHLRYDAPHRRANRQAKLERRGQLPLLGGGNNA